MGTLSDIVGKNPKVIIRGVEIEITGISAQSLSVLIARFPQILELLDGRASSFKLETLVAVGPEFVAALLAAGTGSLADPDAERNAGRLTIDDQFTLLEAIMKWTFADVGEFLARIERAASSTGLALSKASPKPLPN
jgi:DNA integrity scanning protein DisA with diadenylate cyclase activity